MMRGEMVEGMRISLINSELAWAALLCLYKLMHFDGVRLEP